MAKPYRETEKALYEPIRQALIKKFGAVFGDVHIETTSNGKFSHKLKEALDKSTLYIMRVEKCLLIWQVIIEERNIQLNVSLWK